MMNIVALWMLLSSLGAAMILSPEPILTNSGESSHPLKAAKDASKQTFEYAADAARKTGEGIRHTVVAGVQSTGDLAHAAMDAVKYTSQKGLEKIGLDTREKSTFEQWESGLQDAKDRATAKGTWASAAYAADAAEQTAQEKYDNLEKYGTLDNLGAKELAREKYENLKKYGQLEHPTSAEIIKSEALGAYDATKDAAVGASTAVKDTVVGAGEKIQGGAHYAYKTAEETAAEAKNKLENAVGSLKTGSKNAHRYDKESSQSDESVNELASRIAQSVQDRVRAAGSKTCDTASCGKDSTRETIGTAYEYATDSLKNVVGKQPELCRSDEESDPSYPEKLRMATEQAADILMRRGKDAANYMPNVGQGLSMGEISDSHRKQRASEYVESSKDKAGDYYQNTKDTAGVFYDGAKGAPSGTLKERPTNWRETFLNKVGIREEADLYKFDVMVGSVKVFSSGWDWNGLGLFQKAGQTLNDATAETQEHAKTVGDKVSDGMHSVGDHIRHAKDSVVSKAKHMTGTAPEAFHETTDGAKDRPRGAVGPTATGSKFNDTLSSIGISKEGADQKGPFSSVLKWMEYGAVAWIVSCIKAAHLLSFSSTYGASLWFTFASGYLLSKSLTRQQYGLVQSKMFPAYLRVIGVGQAICLVLYMMLHPWTRSSPAEKLQHFNLWTVLMSTLMNMFFLEPRATKAMFEKMQIEEEEGSRAEEEAAKQASDLKEAATSSDDPTQAHSDEINHRFNVLHGWSSTFNLFGLLGETWHLWHLSRALPG